MRKYSDVEFNLVKKIMELSTTTAPVELSIGYVDSKNQCQKGIIVKKAPCSIIRAIIDYDGVIAHLEPDGLHILPL